MKRLFAGVLLAVALLEAAAAKPVILITDLGTDIDDSWALAYALRCPELDLKLVVVDPADTGYRARVAGKLLEAAGRGDIPLALGDNSGSRTDDQRTLLPWIRDYDLARYPGRVDRDGIGALQAVIRAANEPVTVIDIGPAHTLALALRRDPSLAAKCRFVGMDGSFAVGYGGGPPVAETNVKVEPAALRTVLSAPWQDVLLTPLDTCGSVNLRGERYARIWSATSDPALRALIESYCVFAPQQNWMKCDDFATRSTTLFDCVAVYLATSEDLTAVETVRFDVTDDGRTVAAPGGAFRARVALRWRDRDGFERQLADRLAPVSSSPRPVFDVTAFGARGDGRTLDTGAINRAIEAAAAAGGGVVRIPAGTYLSYSIRLRSHLTLQLDPGCTLIAADATASDGYDHGEPNPWGDRLQYQDFGHSHWRNSLIWGENLDDVAIVGGGRIVGRGLARVFLAPPRAPAAKGDGASALRLSGPDGTAAGPRKMRAIRNDGTLDPNPERAGNKAIALVRCRHVRIAGVEILDGGHFAVLATGVDHLVIEGVRVDTHHDGFDLDACRDVLVRGCWLNTASDDAIVLKSSYALGELRPCDGVTIEGCTVSGFDDGTFLGGTFGRTMLQAIDGDGPTGRIKIGTESTGSFHHIRIRDCRFVHCRGLALETVDGGDIDDVVATDLVMTEVSNAPVFVRVGARLRGPAGAQPGRIHGVRIERLTASDVDPRFPLILAGLPGAPITDVILRDVTLSSPGGVTMGDVAAQKAGMVNPFFAHGPEFAGDRDPLSPPEQRKGYPEPSMFGLLPAAVLYVRHASGVTIDGLRAVQTRADDRPSVVLDDAGAVRLERIEVPGKTLTVR